MSIFGKAIGICDWCSTPGLILTEYKGKDVCAPCHTELRDFDRVDKTEEAYQEIHFLLDHSDKNYPSSA